MKNLLPLERNLKIQTNILKRYKKEYLSYKDEKIKELERLEKMNSENASYLKLQQQQNVIEETQKMLPIIKNKIIDQKNSLIQFLNENNEDLIALNGSEIISTHDLLNDIEVYLVENN